MIGNDVVDLVTAQTQSHWQRPGFLEKQFTKDERSDILSSERPFLQVWLFWSMKEAAYKCYTQEIQERFFAPQKFVCEMTSSSSGIIQIREKQYISESTITDAYISTVATSGSTSKMISKLYTIPPDTNSSQFLKNKILARFQKSITLQKNKFGIPSLFNETLKLPYSVSISHHGNYGAFAISNTHDIKTTTV